VRKIKFIYLILIIFITNKGLSQLTSVQKIDSTSNGKTLADFKMISYVGDTVNFYSMKEEIIVFDIWATWCGPCKQQAPKFDSLRKAYLNEKIKFISISIDGTQKKWKRFVKVEESIPLAHQKDHYWVGDSKEHIMNFLCTFYDEIDGQKAIGTGIPQYIIIGKNHKIIMRDAPQPQTGGLEKLIKDLKEEYGI